MDRRLNGSNSLSYLGVNAPTPPNLILQNRPPTVNDYISFILGDIWLDTTVKPPTNDNVYMLTNVTGNVATWISFNGGAINLTLTGNDHIAVSPDGANNINIVTNVANLSFSGNPGTHTVTLTTAGGGPLLETLTGTDHLPVQPDAIGNIDFTTATAGLTITNTAPHTLSFNIAGGAVGTQSFTTDDTNVVTADGAGNVNLFGMDGLFTTGAVANTVTVHAGGEFASQYTTDAGIAIPVANNLNILGGTGCATSGAGDTILASSSGATAITYQTDHGTAMPAAGVLNVLGGVGSGIVTYGAGNTVGIANAAGGIIVTDIVATRNWSKKPATQFIDIYLWCAGGGGQAGALNGVGISTGGRGGTQGALYVMTHEPAATFAATELVTIGAGGAKGLPSGGAGGNGGICSVGTVIVPTAQNNGGGQPGNANTNIINYIGDTVVTVNGGALSSPNNSPAADGFVSDFRVFSPVLNEALAPTGGAGGGSMNLSWHGSGGSSGAIKQANGATIIAGARGSIFNGSLSGSAFSAENGYDGIEYQGILTGGTGGGGGALVAASSGNYWTAAADGGFPGAGGGGGGGGDNSFGGGKGGLGGNGLVRIIEYL